VVFAAGLKPCESDKQKISVNAQIKVIYGGFNRLFHQRGMSFHIRYHFFIPIPGRLRWVGDFADYFCSPDDFIADLNQSFGLGNCHDFSLFELNI
jgi:hypothetical protein